MKLKNFFTMTAIALCMVACSDENDPTPAQEAAKAIEGNYTGLMSMTVSGSTAGESEISVKITAEAEGTVKLSFPAMGDEGSMQLEAFEVSGVAVTASDNGSYTLSKETFSTTSGDINLEGSKLAGTVSNGDSERDDAERDCPDKHLGDMKHLRQRFEYDRIERIGYVCPDHPEDDGGHEARTTFDEFGL